MKYFDAHTHVNFAAYADDLDEVMARACDAGVGMNIVGTQKDTSESAIALAEKYDGVITIEGGDDVEHTSIPGMSVVVYNREKIATHRAVDVTELQRNGT